MYKDTSDEESEQLISNGPGCWERLFYNTKFQIVLVLIVCAFIGIGTPFIWQLVWKISQDCCRIESDLRYDCYPLEDWPTKNSSFCKKKAHCCWDNDTPSDQIQCYYGLVTKDSSTRMPGYSIVNFTKDSAILKVDKVPGFVNITNKDTKNGSVVRHYLSVKVEHFTADHFRVKINSAFPEDEIGYDLEKEFADSLEILRQSPRIQANDSNAKISMKSSNEGMFSLSVRRNDSKQIIFNSGDFSPFIYAKGFIEITTLLPNDLIYGLGQSPSKGFKHNMTYPDKWQIYNKYNLNLTTNQSSWFGSHPFYMGWTNDDKAYGVLLLNSYPMQVITNSRPSLTFRTIGGPLDFHFFLGPTPEKVNKQLLALIGKPSLPPYWALGFHMCRTNNDIDDQDNGAKTIVKNMRQLGIPFDSDCGSAAMSTTFVKTQSGEKNPVDFLKEFYQNNLEDNIKSVVMQVPHRAQDDTHWSESVLTKPDGSAYYGRFYDWLVMESDPKNANLSVIYPSFESGTVDKKLFDEYQAFGDIDGTFLDYNTPLDLSSTLGLNVSVLCPTLIANNTWNKYYYWKLNEYTPCLDSIDPKNIGSDSLSLHNLYGYRHMKAVKTALEFNPENNPHKRRKLIMSLSTFIGSGRYGGHIGTNMNATWDMLAQTHIQTLEFNMYGIPLVGFPVCGFKGKPLDEELCLRWYQLASLQPFMVSHRAFGESLTDPFSFTKSKPTQEALKSSILIRYQLLPYLYTLFYNATTYGDPVVRPLFYDFPKDKKTFRIDNQFLLGSALMASPVIKSKVKSVQAYLPKNGNKETIWYDYYSGRRTTAKEGQKFNLSAIEYHINLHLRGGYVIATQPPGNATNTEESRAKPLQLIAALDLDRHAEGDLFIDDGKTNDSVYMKPNFTVKATNFTIMTNRNPSLTYSPTIDMIKIYGVIHPLDPEYFLVQSCLNPTNHTKIDYIHDPHSGVLTLLKLNIKIQDCDKFFITWSHKDWNKLPSKVKRY